MVENQPSAALFFGRGQGHVVGDWDEPRNVAFSRAKVQRKQTKTMPMVTEKGQDSTKVDRMLC